MLDIWRWTRMLVVELGLVVIGNDPEAGCTISVDQTKKLNLWGR